MTLHAEQVTLRGLGLERSGRWLFRGLDVELPRGRFIAIVGPSGAGKTSLLGCLAGTLAPSEGEVVFRCAHGCHHSPPAFRRRLGIVFQNFLLIGNGTLLHNVLCGRLGRYPWWRTLAGFPRTDREQAFDLLARLGLSAYVHRRAVEVSGGEQQRAALARALFQEPEMFLADEPVSNLDSDLTCRVLEILHAQTRERGCTVACVLHDHRLVERFADLVIALNPERPGEWTIQKPGREDNDAAARH
ncbi:MAG TPA: ATP-binding cassette domain-containing protein [Terrimicrobiaceae bacterium]|nr:ATP-binding cassette domain-containing protein [Terrimicrobiaceae bacterium]